MQSKFCWEWETSCLRCHMVITTILAGFITGLLKACGAILTASNDNSIVRCFQWLQMLPAHIAVKLPAHWRQPWRRNQPLSMEMHIWKINIHAHAKNTQWCFSVGIYRVYIHHVCNIFCSVCPSVTVIVSNGKLFSDCCLKLWLPHYLISKSACTHTLTHTHTHTMFCPVSRVESYKVWCLCSIQIIWGLAVLAAGCLFGGAACKL